MMKTITACVFVIGVGCTSPAVPGLSAAAQPSAATVVMKPVAADSESSRSNVSPASAEAHATDVGAEDRLAGLIGKWESSKFGHQLLTTRPNGTATIDMSLSPLAAALYGRRVTLNLEWSLEGDALTHRIVGGSPERSVAKLIRKYGEIYEYRLVAQDEDRLVIADVNSSADPVAWTAVR